MILALTANARSWKDWKDLWQFAPSLVSIFTTLLSSTQRRWQLRDESTNSKSQGGGTTRLWSATRTARCHFSSQFMTTHLWYKSLCILLHLRNCFHIQEYPVGNIALACLVRSARTGHAIPQARLAMFLQIRHSLRSHRPCGAHLVFRLEFAPCWIHHNSDSRRSRSLRSS